MQLGLRGCAAWDKKSRLRNNGDGPAEVWDGEIGPVSVCCFFAKPFFDF